VEGVSNIPQALDEVIQKASAKKRDDRYISMGQFADALSKALPTQQEMQAVSISSPKIDPGGPGRTYLGPGAGAISDSQPSLSTPSDPNGTGQNFRQPTPQGVPAAAGVSSPAIPASEIGRPKPAPPVTTDPHLDAKSETILKPKAAVAVPLPDRLKSESIEMSAERPREARPSRNLVPVVIVGGLVLAGAVAAGVVLPKMNAPPPPPDPVAVVTPPPPANPPPVVAAPPVTPTAVAAPTPAPAPAVVPPANTGAAQQGGGSNNLTRMVAEETAHNALVMAKNSFIDGQLEGALEHLKTIAPGSKWSPKAKELEEEVEATQHLVERGNTKRAAGDCDGAISLYNQALAKSRGLRDASAGISACKKSAVPTELGGY
jgi:hypothetical protein